MPLLTEREKQRVEAAIGAAEAKSAGEIVVAVHARSDDYALPRALAAVAVAVGLALAVLWVWPGLAPAWSVVGILPAFLVLYLASGRGALCRLLVAPHAINRAVHERAVATFAGRGLHETRDRTGLLICVSELERRVVILADHGIHRLVQDGWQRYVDEITRAIKRGEAADGLVRVIAEVGELLAAHVPRRPDDRNELPDRVIDDS